MEWTEKAVHINFVMDWMYVRAGMSFQLLICVTVKHLGCAMEMYVLMNVP